MELDDSLKVAAACAGGAVLGAIITSETGPGLLLGAAKGCAIGMGLVTASSCNNDAPKPDLDTYDKIGWDGGMGPLCGWSKFNITSSVVSMSGSAILVGSFSDNAAFIYRKNDQGDWSREAVLLREKQIAGISHFGDSVALEGKTALVGSDNIDHNSYGAVSVFSENGGVWSREQQLSPVNAASISHFGASIAISGNTIVVGASEIAGNDSYRPVAYVFENNGGWPQHETQKLVLDDTLTANPIPRVGVSEDTILLGTPAAPLIGSSLGFGPGAAHFFTNLNPA